MAALACTGACCTSQRDLEPSPGFHYETPSAPAQPFESFERTPVELSTPFDETRTHEIMHLTFGSSGHNGHPDNVVEGQYFRSKQPGRKSLVVVMPIWGTSSYPPAKISTGYARRAGNDTNVIWIYGNAPRVSMGRAQLGSDGRRRSEPWRATAPNAIARPSSTCADSSTGRRTNPRSMRRASRSSGSA